MYNPNLTKEEVIDVAKRYTTDFDLSLIVFLNGVRGYEIVNETDYEDQGLFIARVCMGEIC
jgi:hypothetical protein